MKIMTLIPPRVDGTVTFAIASKDGKEKRYVFAADGAGNLVADVPAADVPALLDEKLCFKSERGEVIAPFFKRVLSESELAEEARKAEADARAAREAEEKERAEAEAKIRAEVEAKIRAEVRAEMEAAAKKK